MGWTMADPSQLALRIQRSELEAAVKSAQCCAVSRAAMPILGYLLLDASGSDLEIHATDLNHFIRVAAPCSVDSPGRVALHARQLLDYVSALPNGVIGISETRGHHATLSMPGLETVLPGLPPDSYPPSWQLCDSWKARFPPGVLPGLITHALPTLGTDEEEEALALGSALLRITPEGILMVTTDRTRLSRVEMRQRTPVPEDWQILLPRRLLKILLAVYPSRGEGDPVDIGFTPRAIFFRGGRFLLGARQVAGRYPDFESVIPVWGQEAFFRSGQMMESLTRLKGVEGGAQQRVTLELRPYEMELRTHTPDGFEGTEALRAEWVGPRVTLSLPLRALSGCLSTLRTSTYIGMAFPAGCFRRSSDNVPVGFFAKDNDPYNSLYLLMSSCVLAEEERIHNRATH